jgi:hypothetical protein
MKIIHKVAMLSLLVSTVACSNEDAPATTSVQKEISFVAMHPSEVVSSRVVNDKFEKGDSIGVYLTDADASLLLAGNVINNAKFNYNGSTWTAPQKQYWDKGSYNVYAYYPYSASINDTEDYVFSVQTDQSTNEGYSKSDFLWASVSGATASESPVKLQFSHLLANVIIKLEKGDDYEGEIPSDCEAYVHSTYTQAVIDLSTGGSAKYNDSDISEIKAKKVNNTTFTACVVPQRIDSRRPLVEVVSDKVSYLLEGTISYKQGMQSTIVVTLSKNPEQTKIEIGGSLGGWN